MSKPLRLTMFGLLYFSQGAVMAYFTALNAIYLQSFGLPMSQIGLVGTVALLPFVLKIFLGMLSDRFNLFGMGHRKPYIVIGLLIQAVGMLMVLLFNPGAHFTLYLVLAFVIMTGIALYDTATDGLALDTTPVEDEGTIQGFMVGGRALGVVIVSGVLGVLVTNFSWVAAFIALAVLGLLPLPLVLMMREPARRPEQKFDWSAFKAFARRSIIMLGLLGAVYSFVINGAMEIFNPFMKTFFYISVQTAGFYTMAWGMGVVIGGLFGGVLVDKIGQRRAVLLAIGISFVAILALAGILSPGMGWVIIIAFGVAYGFYETVYFAVSMKASDQRISASMFSILMAVANIGTAVGLGVTGVLVDTAGYRWSFVIIAVFNVIAALFVPAIFGKRPVGQPEAQVQVKS